MIRRVAPLLCAFLTTAASTSLVAAQPKKAPTPAPTPAPAPTPTPAPAGGEAPAAGGEAVTMPEDPPPADMEGTSEDPDAPRGDEPSVDPSVPAKVTRRTGYPIEEALRPITLPQNMSEVGIAPHLQIDPFEVSDALRARYGITRQIQIGLTYLYAGIYNDPATPTRKDYAVHSGRTVALDLTVLLQDWIGVRVGIPVYIDPIAVGLQIGVPMKFIFGEKFAIGGMDDLLEVDISDKFVPSLYSEAQNARAAGAVATNDVTSRGALRFSAYGVYNHTPQLALIGRLGVRVEDFSANQNTNAGVGGLRTFLRAGVLYNVKRNLDIGGSVGFEDVAETGTFGPQAFVQIRI